MAAPMSARFLAAVLRFSSRNRHCRGCSRNSLIGRNLCSAVQSEGSNSSDSRDPAPFFLHPEVQDILKRITKFNVDHIFRSRPTTEYSRPKYQLVTDEELQKIQSTALQDAEERMQMPPVMKAYDPSRVEIISEDPEIENFDTHDLVFTDITYGIKDSLRMIVVRQTDGVLRTATPPERNRILQVYLPKSGQMYNLPRMFEEQNLEKVLKNGKYEYVLDWACVQFEPNDPEYIRVVQRVYEHIESTGSYNDLRSTRHFGTMAFYYAFNDKIEGLLVEMLQNDLLEDAVPLVRLYHILHPSCQSAELAAGKDMDDLEFIKLFVEKDAKRGERVELAIQTYLDSHTDSRAAS